MASEKSPAFSFYAKDFMLGTVRMSLAERGAYITLLAYQWDSGSVPTDPAEVGRVCGCTSAQATKVWAVVGEKFRQGGDGLWRNPRLEVERQKQAAYRELQRVKGQASARARSQPNGNRASTAARPNGEPDVNSPSPSPSPSPERSGRAARGPGRTGAGTSRDPGHRVAPGGRKRPASAPLTEAQRQQNAKYGLD
jgi:uncharacterized protein YdaU (DUF1376 family)